MALLLSLPPSSGLRAAELPVPDCRPVKAYNGAQAWWMTQLPPREEGGTRAAMALLSLPIYAGCAVVDILAFPGRALYNSGWRCSERDRALAQRRDIDSEISKAQQRRARLKQIAAKTPPRLALWAEFDDSRSRGVRRNNMLDAEESAELRLTVRNEGSGPAHDVTVLVERERGPSEVSLGDVPALGDLPAGKARTVRVPITAAESLSRGDLALRVEGKEELGYDADPILLVVPALSLPAPELSVTEAGAEGGDRLALGAPIRLGLRVANRGEGPAHDVKLRLLAQDPEINLAAPEEIVLGDLAPFGHKDAGFRFSLSKAYQGPRDLPLYAVLSEKHALFSKPPQRLPLRVGTALAALPEFSARAPRPPRLEFEVSCRDGSGGGVLAGGQGIVLKVHLRNIGSGVARDVAVALSGNKTLVDVLGGGKAVGDLAPGREETVELTGTLPANPPAKASLDVRLSEARGFAPAQVRRLALALRSPAPHVEKVVDVDLVPSSSFRAPRRLAIVIGVGRHRDAAVPALPGASHDAEVLARYLESAGGVAKDHLRLLRDENALATDFKEVFEDWLPRMAKASGPAEVLVYYAGHGTPDPETGDYFLVPFEGSAAHPEGLYPLAAVYSALARAPLTGAVVVLDSCFSGGGRSLAPRGRPLISASRAPLPAHTALLAAASGGQVSNEKQGSPHGLFTYYLLAGLQGQADADHEGRVQLEELSDYLKRTVPQAAASESGAPQEPEVRPEPLDELGAVVLTGY